jgi:hypothetical protein
MNKVSSILFLVALAVSWSAPATEDSFVCGDSKIRVSPGTSRGGTPATDFIVNVESGDRKKAINYSSENDFLALRCESDRDGRKLIVVNHTCSGSGCAEMNWGIVRLDTLEVLLQPDQRSKGNHSKAESIVGTKLNRFSCHERVKATGEYCYRVKEM